jgi:transcription initiation factor TFIID subunit 11
LFTLARYIIPAGHDLPRFLTTLGIQLVVLGIHFSSPVRDLLSNRYFLWLGRQSFAVYLIHGPLMRSVLAWCLFRAPQLAPTPNRHKEARLAMKLELRGPLVIAFVLPLWFALMYSCAAMWTRWVDPMFARWTQQIERYVTGAESEKGSLPVYS